MTTPSGRDRIREIVLERTELEDSALDETSRFVDDYALDSMTIVEIQAAIEMEYDVVFTKEQSQRMTDLAAVRQVFAEARAATGAALEQAGSRTA